MPSVKSSDDYKSHGSSLKPANERRSEPRYPVKDLAQIKIPFDKQRISCMILDLSTRGAVIEVSTRQIPDHFIMINRKAGKIMACKVIWRNHSRIGLKFIKPPGYSPMDIE